MSSFEFAKLAHPSKYKRRKAEEAERQRQELHKQTDAVRQATRAKCEHDLAKIKIAIDKVRAEIESWYTAELAIANEQYANNKAEYDAADKGKI